jgi:hypothetical protein
MSKLQDKNLLFYSIHPNDKYSQEFRQELEKNPGLKKQFVLICVNDPSIKIPNKIRQLNKIPVLVAAGFNRPIMGPDAVSWLRNGGFQGKANGFEFGSLEDDNDSYAYLTDEFDKSDYNQFYNSEYNLGFTDKDSMLNQQFSKLSDNAHITTYDDSNEMKKDIASQLEQRLSNLRVQRDKDVPKAMKRIGGLDHNDFLNGNRPGNGQGITYNPNPYGSHQMPQQTNPQLPFQMPNMPGVPNMQMQMPQMQPMQQRQNPMQLPQMPSAGRSGPSLPFNMGGFSNSGQSMPQLPFQMGGMPKQSMYFKNPNI